MAEEGNNNNNNNQQHAHRDYFRSLVNNNYSGIRQQMINANKFELKLALISVVQQNQYGGLL